MKIGVVESFSGRPTSGHENAALVKDRRGVSFFSVFLSLVYSSFPLYFPLPVETARHD